MKNPFAQEKQPIQLTLEAAPAVLDVIELRAEETALAITRHIEAVKPHLVLIADEAGADALEQLAQAIAKQMNAPLKLRRLQLKPIDWVKQVQKDFPSFTLGRFFVHGSHETAPPPKNSFPLLIDAAAAFGTGEHATTAGCLVALAIEKKRRPHASHILDMGCGTAILALGAAYLWKESRLAACDNDAVAVEVSAINLRANRMVSRGKAWVSDGYRHARVRRQPYDIIVANILAKPLMRMARAQVAALAPDGTLILSGLLHHQERMVLAAYRAQGLYLRQRLRRGQWSVLVLTKRGTR